MTGLIILAAGESSRLGKRKQKVIFDGKGLLQRTIDAALNSECKPVIVVLGAYREEIKADINTEDAIVCYNPEWEEGMSSSIRSGIKVLQENEFHVSDVILMVCDQPFADTFLITGLINKKASTGKAIIACSYNGTVGVPVLFDKKFFSELLSLKGQEGAKKLIKRYNESVAEIPFPLGKFDIDTIEDYEALLKSQKV